MYQQSITRLHRTAFLFLIDSSGSMAEEISFMGQRCAKAKAVAQITNNLLFELLERSRREGEVRDYYDLAVLSYGGNDQVQSLLSPEGKMLSITQLEKAKIEDALSTSEYRLPDGRTTLRESISPVWILPHAAGQTPMCEALRHARDLVKEWCQQPAHQESFPPVVFNITDGEATDCEEAELKQIASQIKSTKTNDGNVLLIQIHLSTMEGEPELFFPSEEERPTWSQQAMTLFDCSSKMPTPFNEEIRTSKSTISRPPYRGMSFNASPSELIAMLNIGSISIKTE